MLHGVKVNALEMNEEIDILIRETNCKKEPNGNFRNEKHNIRNKKFTE